MSENSKKWEEMPPVKRDYLKQELANNGIDIEKLLLETEENTAAREKLCPANEKLLTKKEAAGIAKCSISTLNRLIKSGTIKTTKFNHARQGAVRIFVASFEAWLKQKTVTA